MSRNKTTKPQRTGKRQVERACKARSQLPYKRATMPEPTRPDIYQRVTNQIIAAIEAGADQWNMPWHSGTAESLTRPINAETGKPYRGINIVALWAEAEDKGYSSREWATFKQWDSLGAKVRKGEHASWVVFWKIDQAQDGEESAEPEEGSGPRIFARGYPVFNADQVDGYHAPTPPIAATTIERIAHAEAFFSAVNAAVRHGGHRAYYSPATDHIQMPPFEAFRDSVAYYSTLGHEATHWTGADRRLARDLKGRFGTESYAAEELVAELGAAFLCADLDLSNEPRPDHAAYAATWLKILRSDSRAIFTAASKAQQAVAYLHDFQQSAPQLKAPIGAPAPFAPLS